MPIRIKLQWGRVLEAGADQGGRMDLVVETPGGERRKAVAYPVLLGTAPAPGQRVLLNQTAAALKLGSGSGDLVLAVAPEEPEEAGGPSEPGAAGSPGLATPGSAWDHSQGHIMKLRYTGLQFSCLSVEEEASPYRQALQEAEQRGLEGMPVVLGTLHSHLLPAVLGLEAAGAPRVAYIMTDGAALPLVFSQVVRHLRSQGHLAGTITYGQAFGGDLEAVNKFSALLASRAALRAQVAVVTMGPGIVGTGTLWGHTAVEQGELVDAVNTLGGRPVVIPRLSFADPRQRHRGLSHHFLTALGKVAHSPADIVLPAELTTEQRACVEEQIRSAGLLQPARWRSQPHRLWWQPVPFLPAALEAWPWPDGKRTMGRSWSEDPALFAAAAAAGYWAGQLLREGHDPLPGNPTDTEKTEKDAE